MAEREQQFLLTAQGDMALIGRKGVIAHRGRGGMADVSLAAAPGPASFNKLVVVKRHREALGANDNDVRMFLDEAKLSARLHHANIVQTYEVGVQDGGYFIVMEYLEGQPLNRIIKAVTARHPGTDRFRLGVGARILADTLAGPHYAHELRDYDGTPLEIVHRDISPQNLFVTYDGVAKIVDFGIAKAVLNTANTATGVVKGKIAYMSP